MLKVVMNGFGVPHYDSNHGRYLMEDQATGRHYWLDDQAYAESLDYIKADHIKAGMDEQQAYDYASVEAFENWDDGMEAIEETIEEA